MFTPHAHEHIVVMYTYLEPKFSIEHSATPFIVALLQTLSKWLEVSIRHGAGN